MELQFKMMALPARLGGGAEGDTRSREEEWKTHRGDKECC